MSGSWAADRGDYTCVNTQALYTAGILSDILTDGKLNWPSPSCLHANAVLPVAILALPVYNVWKLQMPKARKLAVIGIFLLGALEIITAIVRLVYVVDAFTVLATDL